MGYSRCRPEGDIRYEPEQTLNQGQGKVKGKSNVGLQIYGL